jgi:hypothetical protein
LIYSYGITEQGAFHIRNNIVCQDAHEIIKCPNGIAIAAVADGLGSEKHSDIASKIAVKVSTKYCADHIENGASVEKVLEIIRSSFFSAQRAIEEEAIRNDHELDQYGTTLSLAILNHDTLFYGHAGDSGIIALTTDGMYTKITSQQQDDMGRVFQLLCNDQRWVFAVADKKVSSVLLATDGILATFSPIYLRNQPADIYVPLLQYFMDNSRLRIDIVGEHETTQRIGEFIRKIPGDKVDDDKTLVVLVNPNVQIASQPPEYYAEPDWVELKRQFSESWKIEAYPHLYSDENLNASQEFNEITEILKDEPTKNLDDVENTDIPERSDLDSVKYHEPSKIKTTVKPKVNKLFAKFKKKSED